MLLRVYCRGCLFTTHVNDDRAGHRMTCPQCGESILVPVSDSEADVSSVNSEPPADSPGDPPAQAAPVPAPSRNRRFAIGAGAALAFVGTLVAAFCAGQMWATSMFGPRTASRSFATVGDAVGSPGHPVTSPSEVTNPYPAPTPNSAVDATKPPAVISHDFGPEPPQPLAEHFPRRIAEGASFAHQLPRSAGVQYELIDGPAGMAITSGGKVTWVPSRRQLGVHELKIRVQRDGLSLFERPSIEVVDREHVTADDPLRIPAAELHALGSISEATALTSKEIGRRYLNAVVVVHSDRSVGTGFVVGKNGYVLTCAHVLPEDGQMILAYNLTRDGRTEAVSTTAVVVLVDEGRDLALLKIQPREPLAHVILHDGKSIETGEAITVIGNPGLGSTILTHTMTTGIVSNPDRELDGQHYIQSSAAVNPGNSGGPMFDSTGRVVGLISLKADIEGAGFAVPARVLREFLQRVIDGKTVTSP